MFCTSPRSVHDTENMFIQNSYRFFSDISVFDDPAIGSFTVKTDNTGTSNDNQFTVPLNQNTSDYTITTEDGQVIENLTDSYTITFPTSGTYKIAITGNAFRGFFFANSSFYYLIINLAF